MTKRKLGNWQVAPLALGGNVFGWTVTGEALGFRLLDAFVDAGFSLIDTADIYSNWVQGHGGGESETFIGRWLKQSGKRSKVLLATKVGKPMGADRRGLSKKYILSAVEDSLRRLQTDTIDLYQSHEDDAATPLEETLEAFGQLIREGKVRAIGASNYSGARLEEALAVSERAGLPRYVCLQPHYSLIERADYETQLEPVCRAKGLAVIPYFSLASGFLTGKYRSEKDLGQSVRGGGIKKYLNERGSGILAALDEVAAKLNSTPARVAIAWLMARPSVTAPIASATRMEHMTDLIEAARLELDAASIERLNQASAYAPASAEA